MKLSKEQKMNMISKAIDAGFEVELKLHRVDSEKQLDEANAVFDRNITRDMAYAKSSNSQSTWLSINEDREFEDRFTATMFIDSLRGEPS